MPPAEAKRPVWDVWQAKQTIYIVNRDGTGLQQLVDEAGPYAQNPVLSPDGNEVLYTQETNGRFQIFKLDLISGVRTQLTDTGGPIQANAGGDWFDPDYTFAGLAATPPANHNMGRSQKETRKFLNPINPSSDRHQLTLSANR